MPGPIAIEEQILNYDPEFPQERFCSAGAAAVSKNERLPPRSYSMACFQRPDNLGPIPHIARQIYAGWAPLRSRRAQS